MQKSFLKIAILLFFGISAFNCAFAQYRNNFQATDSIMLAIPDQLTYSTQDIANFIDTHFDEDIEQLSAIFTWLTHNITYDLGEQRDYLPADELESYILETLKQRKGICQAYAEVFHDICQKLSIPSQVVSGFAIAEEDKTPVSHAWIAAYESSSWKLFDATFGAGYVMEGKYFKEIDSVYFNADPDFLIQSHYPFDPMWQLKFYPENMPGFLDTENIFPMDSTYFYYPDSIAAYMALSEPEKLVSEKRRILDYSEENPILSSYLDVLDHQIDYYIRTDAINIYNQCIENYNLAVSLFNEKLAERNPDKISDEKKQDQLEAIEALQTLMRQTNNMLSDVESDDEEFLMNIVTMKQAISALLKNVAQIEKSLRDWCFVSHTWCLDKSPWLFFNPRFASAHRWGCWIAQV